MTNLLPTDAVQKFNDIAAAFDKIATDESTVDAESQPNSQPVGPESWMAADRSEFRPSRILRRRQIITQFGELVSQAGTLLLECCRSGLLHDNDALDVFAAYELGSWGGLCVNPANAFSYLAGGPEFKEVDSFEASSEYGKLDREWPIDTSTIEPGNTEELLRRLRPYPLPDPKLCQEFSATCRRLAVEISASAKTADQPIVISGASHPRQLVSDGADGARPEPGLEAFGNKELASSGEEDSSDNRRQQIIAKLTPAERKAYLSREVARVNFDSDDSNPTERELYDWLGDEYDFSDEHVSGELKDYQLPTFETWSRYSRNAREALDEQKYQKRPRTTGRSIILPQDRDSAESD